MRLTVLYFFDKLARWKYIINKRAGSEMQENSRKEITRGFIKRYVLMREFVPIWWPIRILIPGR